MQRQLKDIDRKVLHQVAEGSASAFSDLFHAYSDKLYSFTFSLCESAQQSEDIVQDIFLKIWLMRSDLHRVRDFQSYLFRMSHNHCLNILKRRALESSILIKIQDSGKLARTERKLEFKETEAFLHKAIEGLPAQQRQVFVLSRANGLNHKEISEQLHISVPTVKSHLTQALRALRSRCKNLYPVIKAVVILIGLSGQ